MPDRKPKHEIRVVCANHGQAGHADHAWNRPTLAKAKQSVIDLDHRAEMNRTAYYHHEAPYRIETREVGAWTNVD